MDNVSGLSNVTTAWLDMEIHLPLYTKIINILIGTLTIIFNLSVVLCISSHRRRFSTVLWYQIFCLGISDMLAGWAPLSLMLFSSSVINTSTTACKIIILTFHICQLATLLNLSHMSARRLYVVGFKKTQNQTICSYKVLVSMSVLSWMLSFALLLPALIYMTSSPVVNGCLSPLMFKDEQSLKDAINYSVYIQSTPVVFLNIMYVTVIVKLGVSRNSKINPSVLNDRNHGDSNRIFYTRTLVQPKPSSKPQSSRRLLRSIQMQALWHLIIVLTVVNCTTWPYFTVSLLLSNGMLTYDIPVIDLQIVCLNSLLNPLIYSLSIKEVRHVYKEVATLVFRRLCRFQ